MGKIIRIVAERNRQRFGLGIRDFEPTSNRRNEAMFAECTEFSKQLQQTKGQMQSMIKATKAYTEQLSHLFNSPKPRIYEEARTGHAVPLDPNPVPLGTGVQTERLESAVQQMHQSLLDIITPIDSWLGEYGAIKVEMRKLEDMRLEVDSRRRTVSDLQYKLQRSQTMLQRSHTLSQHGDDRNREKLERLGTSLQGQRDHKQTKLDGVAAGYREAEQDVFTKLKALIEDIDFLTGHLRLATVAFRDTFQAQIAAYGAVPTPPATAAYDGSVPPQKYPSVIKQSDMKEVPLGTDRDTAHRNTVPLPVANYPSNYHPTGYAPRYITTSDEHY